MHLCNTTSCERVVYLTTLKPQKDTCLNLGYHLGYQYHFLILC